MNKIIKEYEKERQYFDVPKTAEERAKEIFLSNYSDITWKPLNQPKMHIGDMTSNHIANCIAWIGRKGENDYNTYWTTIFRLELIKRDIGSKELADEYEDLAYLFDKDQERIAKLKEANRYQAASLIERDLLNERLGTLLTEAENKIYRLKVKLQERNNEEIQFLKGVLCSKK